MLQNIWRQKHLPRTHQEGQDGEWLWGLSGHFQLLVEVGETLSVAALSAVCCLRTHHLLTFFVNRHARWTKLCCHTQL